MSYQLVVASSEGENATMAKSFIITLEGKFLLNFQGYRPDTDALAELSLYK
jgi:hypothetical protein